MSTQITNILPKSEWEKIIILENHDPIVQLEENQKMIFGKNIAPHPVGEYKLRKTVAEMLYKASELLPKDYKLAVIEGVRSLSKQKEHWDKKTVEFKKLHPEWSDEEIEYQVRLVVAKPLPLANHNCGGAVDVTLVDLNNNPVDMGTVPQAMIEKEKVEMFSKLITEQQAEKRRILREVMEQVGFVWYPGEWWHYCYGDRMWAVYSRREECFYGPIEMEKSIYNNGWFKKRAFASIHQIASHTWDYSDSLLLYISSGVEIYESLQATDTPYFKLITQPERDYLKSIAKDVVELLPQKFEYIDLGPGTEHKEQFFFDELKRQGKEFTYIPVDISEHYLTLAEKYAKDQGITVKTIQSSFEELLEVLGTGNLPRFVNIGLTFSNYKPQTIFDLMKKIAGSDGYVFINSQMRDRVDMVALEKVYAEDALTLADEKLKLLDLNPNTDVTQREANDKIEVWSTVINLTPKLKEMGIAVGDKMLLFQSLRYTPEELETELKKTSEKYRLFDTGESFIAVLINT